MEAFRANPDADVHRHSPAVRVLLTHGDIVVRTGWRGLLDGDNDIAVAGEAADGDEAVLLAREIRPDLVLMNLRLPGLGGVEATRQIIADPRLSEVEVLLMSEDERDEDLLPALRAGANGFLPIDTDPEELLRAVRTLARGGMHLSPSVTRRLIDRFVRQPAQHASTAERFKRLSGREREVVSLVALGLNNREIAEQLEVSPATAKTHVSRSMVKLHAPDRAKLIALAYESGFAQLSDERAFFDQPWPQDSLADVPPSPQTENGESPRDGDRQPVRRRPGTGD